MAPVSCLLAQFPASSEIWPCKVSNFWTHCRTQEKSLLLCRVSFSAQSSQGAQEDSCRACLIALCSRTRLLPSLAVRRRVHSWSAVKLKSFKPLPSSPPLASSVILMMINNCRTDIQPGSSCEKYTSAGHHKSIHNWLRAPCPRIRKLTPPWKPWPRLGARWQLTFRTKA